MVIVSFHFIIFTVSIAFILHTQNKTSAYYEIVPAHPPQYTEHSSLIEQKNQDKSDFKFSIKKAKIYNATAVQFPTLIGPK